jgi:hypothetical protein
MLLDPLAGYIKFGGGGGAGTVEKVHIVDQLLFPPRLLALTRHQYCVPFANGLLMVTTCCEETNPGILIGKFVKFASSETCK